MTAALPDEENEEEDEDMMAEGRDPPRWFINPPKGMCEADRDMEEEEEEEECGI